MTHKENSEVTTCPFTGRVDSWTETEYPNGTWKGYSSADGSTISAESYEALRFRYEKVTLARLFNEESKD